jgi:hypothetical protein
MSGKIALFLTVAILTFCGLSAAVDSGIRRKRRVLHIESVDDGRNLHSLPMREDSDLWGRHLLVGSPNGDRMKGGKNMMMGMMMDAKKSGGMSEGGIGGMDKGGMGVMNGGIMTKKENADFDIDGFWVEARRLSSMSLPVPTDPPTDPPTDLDVTILEMIEMVYGASMSLPVPTDSPTRAAPTNAPTPTPPTESPSLQPTSSSAPSSCNAQSRREAFFNILEDITSPSLLNNSSTPQGFAYEFLVSGDPAFVDPCSNATVEQRYAMVVLYNSTNGKDWTNSAGWLTAEQECNWYGVTCNDDDLVTELLLCK